MSTRRGRLSAAEQVRVGLAVLQARRRGVLWKTLAWEHRLSRQHLVRCMALAKKSLCDITVVATPRRDVDASVGEFPAGIGATIMHHPAMAA